MSATAETETIEERPSVYERICDLLQNHVPMWHARTRTENDQQYFLRIADKLSKNLPEEQWKSLDEDIQQWIADAAESASANRDIPDPPGYRESIHAMQTGKEVKGKSVKKTKQAEVAADKKPRGRAAAGPVSLRDVWRECANRPDASFNEIWEWAESRGSTLKRATAQMAYAEIKTIVSILKETGRIAA